MKKRLPSSFLKIKAVRSANAIDPGSCRRIEALWREMLTEARTPKSAGAGLDGVTYHFSAQIPGRGILAGKTWSPRDGTRCGALAELTAAMFGYSKRQISIEKLEEFIDRAEQKIHPSSNSSNES